MTVNSAIYTCSICGEPSTEICAYCTKDACVNHRCQRCKRCSDCCECEVPLSASDAAPQLEQPQAAQAAGTPPADTPPAGTPPADDSGTEETPGFQSGDL